MSIQCAICMLSNFTLLQVSNFNEEELRELLGSARIKPSVVQRYIITNIVNLLCKFYFKSFLLYLF